MSLLLALQARVQARQLAQSTRKKSQRPRVIVLPTTCQAIALARALVSRKDLTIGAIGNVALMNRLLPEIAGRTMTPLAIWREAKQNGVPALILSFFDQTVGFGPSFRNVEIDGETITCSTIEIMMAMRFGAEILVAADSSRWRRIRKLKALSLHLLTLQMTNPVSDRQLDDWIKRIASPLMPLFSARHDHWYADEVFAAKTLRGRRMLAFSQLAEVETILRLCPLDTLGTRQRLDLQGHLRSTRRRLLDGGV